MKVDEQISDRSLHTGPDSYRDRELSIIYYFLITHSGRRLSVCGPTTNIL